MKYPKQVWDRLKNVTVDDVIKALEKDGWTREITTGATLPYRHEDGRRVVIHYHPKKTYGPKFLKGILEDIGWEVNEMKKLKLI